MAQRDRQSPQPKTEDAKTSEAEEILNSVLEELESLHQSVKEQLSEDIHRLHTEKNQLIEEIDRLRVQQQQLQSQQVQSLSQRQIAQQQLWLKQLAQVLANNLQEQLLEKFKQLAASSESRQIGPGPDGGMPLTAPVYGYNDQTTELMSSLDASLARTFQNLQQELNSYQSELSQRLSYMQSLEQQGEAVLETLVSRLRQELETQNAPPVLKDALLEPSSTTVKRSLEGTPTPAPAPPAPKPASQTQFGLIMALASAGVLSLFNVCIRILIKKQTPHEIFGGLFQIDGLISPNFGNSLLILLLRLIVVMLLMPILATFLYPAVWDDLKRFFYGGDRDLTMKVLGSAFFLFLSQVCIYIALGNITPGIAITIFFIYPIATVLGAWVLFGNRPTLVGTCAMFGITLGLLIAGSPSLTAKITTFGNPVVGITTALGAGITFAGYVLLTQMAAGKLHPIPFSLLNFAGIFVFSAISLIIIGVGFPLPDGWSVNIDPTVKGGLLIGGIILGVLTLFSYLLNNYAIRFAGAALASVVGTLGPALTGLFALIIVGENLKPIQWMGMAVVTASVAAMSLERMLAPKKT